MRILGIDPALRITGFGLIDWNGRDFSLVTAGTVAAAEKDTMPRRLLTIHTAVTRLIAEFKPDVMVLEKIYAHSRFPATAFVLGQARGVICLACGSAGIPLAEYAATRVKKSLTGKGLASKAQVQRTVAGLLGMKNTPRYFDVTDALALAIAFCYLAKAETLKKNSFTVPK